MPEKRVALGRGARVGETLIGRAPIVSDRAELRDEALTQIVRQPLPGGQELGQEDQPQSSAGGCGEGFVCLFVWSSLAFFLTLTLGSGVNRPKSEASCCSYWFLQAQTSGSFFVAGRGAGAARSTSWHPVKEFDSKRPCFMDFLQLLAMHIEIKLGMVLRGAVAPQFWRSLANTEGRHPNTNSLIQTTPRKNLFITNP